MTAERKFAQNVIQKINNRGYYDNVNQLVKHAKSRRHIFIWQSNTPCTVS
jgi:hypothetical protein